MKNIVIFTLLATLLFSCAPSRFVIPLERKSHAVAAELGGPMIVYNNLSIPTPLISVTHAYGWKKNTTFHQSLHLTSLAYGTFQYEAGLLKNLFYNEKSKIGSSYTFGANFMIDRWEWQPAVYPNLDWNFYWYLSGQGGKTCDCPTGEKQKIVFYAGLNNWLELRSTRPHGIAQEKRLLTNPQAGLIIYGRKLNWQLESKWIASSVANNNVVVDYIGYGNKGAAGVYISVFKIL